MRRLTIVLATVAAFLVVSVAQAAANGIAVTHISGNGKGEVSSVGGVGAYPGELEPGVPFSSLGNAYEGTPATTCSYASPGPTTGNCESEMGADFGPVGIALHAVPAAGSEFAGWKLTNLANEPLGSEGQVNCESKPNCFALASGGEGEKIAAAVFCTTGTAAGWGEPCAVSGPALTIAKAGEGTVTSSPAGIVCTAAKTGAECESSFTLNSTVTLTASPAAGYAFSAWGGCLTHEGLKCTVLMDKPKTVKIAFVATPSLTIEKSGSGYGKVAASGISCDESCSKESSAVKTGTSVTVKTTPAKGNEAAVIEGGTGSASTCSGATCTFTISENSSLKVKFSPIPSKTLTVKLIGPGAYKGKVSGKGTTIKGLVSTSILCGSGCTTETESFFSGGTTELVASTVTGYKFAGWTVTGGTAGTCTGTVSPCSLLTDANKTVEAKFE